MLSTIKQANLAVKQAVAKGGLRLSHVKKGDRYGFE